LLCLGEEGGERYRYTKRDREIQSEKGGGERACALPHQLARERPERGTEMEPERVTEIKAREGEREGVSE